LLTPFVMFVMLSLHFKYSLAVDAPGDYMVKGTQCIYSRSARHPI
jgi:hypothetical protein